MPVSALLPLFSWLPSLVFCFLPSSGASPGRALELLLCKGCSAARDLACKYFTGDVRLAKSSLGRGPLHYLSVSSKRALASYFTPSYLTLIRETVNEIK